MWTLELWILLDPVNSANEILSIENADNSVIRIYEHSSSHDVMIECKTSSGITFTSEITYNILTHLNFKITAWKKFILTFNSGAISFQID